MNENTIKIAQCATTAAATATACRVCCIDARDVTGEEFPAWDGVQDQEDAAEEEAAAGEVVGAC